MATRLRRRGNAGTTLSLEIWAVGAETFDGHEDGMATGPLKRLTFGFEEAIDHKRVAFDLRSPRKTRRLAIANRLPVSTAARVSPVGRRMRLAKRNAAWINRAVAIAKACAGGATMVASIAIGPGSSTRPINCDPGKDGIGGFRDHVFAEGGRTEAQRKAEDQFE